MMRASVAMPLRLVPDGRFQLRAHTLTIQPFEGNLFCRMQTRLDLAVGSQPQAVTIATEMCAHRTDETDIPLRIRQTVQPRNAAVLLDWLRLRATPPTLACTG